MVSLWENRKFPLRSLYLEWASLLKNYLIAALR
jgi:hypothetical protein